MNPAYASEKVYIDTPPAYSKDKLFDTSNAALNRDDALVPYARVREAHQALGRKVQTADYLMQQEPGVEVNDYYSLGVLDNFNALRHRTDVRLRAFVVLEPPVVDPGLYKALPELTAAFERVYVHNVHGDGYSLKGVDVSRLRKLYWPQPRRDVIEQHWGNRERMHRIVVINGNHVPRRVPNELYSKRIEAMAAMAQTGAVDLYGRGWAKWWSRASMWWPYWKHRSALMSIYKGACASKYEVLGKYQFSLCFENMAMQGYVTEKIFDCFYAGTIPLYWGASDIKDLIPEETYIDCRKFSSWDAMLCHVESVTEEEISRMREKGRAFVQGRASLKYSESLMDVFGVEAKT